MLPVEIGTESEAIGYLKNTNSVDFNTAFADESEFFTELKVGKEEVEDLWATTPIPFIVKNVKFMCPGTHSGIGGTYTYTPQVIEYSYQNTDWNKQTSSLYLEHRDEFKFNPLTGKKDLHHGADVRDWVGFGKNLRYENGDLLGDAWICDKQTAVKIRAGAQMGISPRGNGKHINGKAVEMLIENFSLTVNPAIKTNFFNVAMSEVKDTMDDETKNLINSMAETVKGLDTKIGTISTEMAEVKKKVEEYPKPVAGDADKEKLKKKEEEEKLKAKEKNEEKLSEGDRALFTELQDNLTKFGTKYREKNPKASDFDVKEAYAKLGEGEVEPEKIEPEGDKPEGDKTPEGDKAPEENKDVEKTPEEKEKEEKDKKLENDVKELQEKMKAPDIKSPTVTESGEGNAGTKVSDAAADKGFMEFLQTQVVKTIEVPIEDR